jgi:uncharacterized protein YbjT (DUF2867 family)
MSERLIFVAGASGAVGRNVVKQGTARGVSLRAHYRKPPEGGAPEGAVIGSLADQDWLVAQMKGVTTVVQLIGTVRKRFAKGDTYETSDVGTTVSLVEAARRASSVDHLVLLSSVGAGRPIGAYLRAKARAEALVMGSAIPWTVLRPSAFDGEEHHVPGFGFFSKLPLGMFRPIKVDDLAKAILHVAASRQPLDTVLEGDALFDVVGKSS